MLKNYVSSIHKKTQRDYLKRVTEFPKEKAAEIAKQFGKDYWDGDRHVGYGGFRYDGRWRTVAEKLAKNYKLKKGSKVLDIGCGKGFLLYDLTQVVPGLKVTGIDISEYAVKNAKPEIQKNLKVGKASKLPFPNHSFDLVISINTLHNLYANDLYTAFREIERVGKKNKYICVESYRSEKEKVNLLYWQLTCEAFCTPKEWQWWFDLTSYKGDHEFIYFE